MLVLGIKSFARKFQWRVLVLTCLLSLALPAQAIPDQVPPTADIEALLGPNEAIAHVQPLGGGFVNDLWLIDTPRSQYVLRAPHVREPTEVFARSLQVGQMAADAGLAPHILAVNRDKQQLLLEYVSSAAWPAYQDDFQPYLDTMKALRAFHQQLSPWAASWPMAGKAPFASIFERADQLATHQQLPVHFAVAEQRCQRIFACLQSWLSQHATLCHGDFHKGNVLLKAGNGKWQPLLIDFDSAIWGHPFFDIAKFSVGMDRPSRLALLKAYLGRELTSADTSHFELMDLALLMLVAVVRYASALAHADVPAAECLVKEQAEALLSKPEQLPSFSSIAFGEQAPRMRQLGAIYALGEFLRRTEGADFEDVLLITADAGF